MIDPSAKAAGRVYVVAPGLLWLVHEGGGVTWCFGWQMSARDFRSLARKSLDGALAGH